jgi:hypothetical protein
MGGAVALLVGGFPVGALANHSDAVLVVLSGAQRVTGGEHSCFVLDESDQDRVNVRVTLHFDSRVPRGRVQLDGMRSPRFDERDENFDFWVSPRGSHRVELDMDDPATLRFMSLTTDRTPIEQISCSMGEELGQTYGVDRSPWSVNQLERNQDRYEPIDQDHDGVPDRYYRNRDGSNRPRQVADSRTRYGGVLPSGTPIDLVLDQRLTTRNAYRGQLVTAHVANDVRADGRTVLEAGTRVEGHVTQVKDAGHFGRSIMVLSFDRVRHPDGSQDDIHATVQEVGPGSGGKQAGIIAGSAVGGAVLGKVLGGDDHDAVLGALVGGGIAAGSIAAKPGESVVLPEGSMITIRLDGSASIGER